MPRKLVKLDARPHKVAFKSISDTSHSVELFIPEIKWINKRPGWLLLIQLLSPEMAESVFRRQQSSLWAIREVRQSERSWLLRGKQTHDRAVILTCISSCREPLSCMNTISLHLLHWFKTRLFHVGVINLVSSSITTEKSHHSIYLHCVLHNSLFQAWGVFTNMLISISESSGLKSSVNNLTYKKEKHF